MHNRILVFVSTVAAWTLAGSCHGSTVFNGPIAPPPTGTSGHSFNYVGNIGTSPPFKNTGDSENHNYENFVIHMFNFFAPNPYEKHVWMHLTFKNTGNFDLNFQPHGETFSEGLWPALSAANGYSVENESASWSHTPPSANWEMWMTWIIKPQPDREDIDLKPWHTLFGNSFAELQALQVRTECYSPAPGGLAVVGLAGVMGVRRRR